MTTTTPLARVETGIRNLDAILGGGIPRGSLTVIAGPPGSGKTTLAQQICFHNASASRRVLYFNTLSEPTAKTLRYSAQFRFFDPAKLEEAVQFVDLGDLVRSTGLEQTRAVMLEHLRRVKPAFVVFDSFKVFDDLATSDEELRKFGYEIAVNLMAWETTALLLGEYGPTDIEGNPLFSIVDGLIMMSQRAQSGEHQRFCQVVKMRGTGHSRDEHAFVITERGIDVFAPRITIRRQPQSDADDTERCRTGISKLDVLLGEGIPRGSSLLIAGAAGTGKTALLLEFVYRGALAGEKGILISFEETEERLRALARGLGWELDREIERGMVEIVFIPQPEIMVEGDLLMMRERVVALSAKRVAIDSVSVFLHKIDDAQLIREKTFQLASVVQNTRAVGFFATDVPYGAVQISRFGVEETIVDGVILLSAAQEGLERQRYLEVYKLRNTAHLKGRHSMAIGPGGVTVFPRYVPADFADDLPPPLDITRRLSTGITGLDTVLGGGALERSVTLVSGSAGVGKTTLALQFLLAGVARGERGIYIALEEGPAQLVAAAEALGLPLRAAVESSAIEIVRFAPQHTRAAQFLSLLTDAIQARRPAQRLVLDSASHIVTSGVADDEVRELLYSLVTRFKTLGVTSMLTLEAPSMFSSDTVSDRGLSPVADNVLVMRYALEGRRMQPMLTVVKSRGSAHDRMTHAYDIAKGGIMFAATAARGKRGAVREEPPRRPAPRRKK